MPRCTYRRSVPRAQKPWSGAFISTRSIVQDKPRLSRPSEALTGLAGLLDPLLGNPDLLRTLKAYLDTGLDRRRTAELLHVHPNTVDYRLRRAVALTGLDPVDPDQLQRIGAALAARRTLNGG